MLPPFDSGFLEECDELKLMLLRALDSSAAAAKIAAPPGAAEACGGAGAAEARPQLARPRRLPNCQPGAGSADIGSLDTVSGSEDVGSAAILGADVHRLHPVPASPPTLRTGGGGSVSEPESPFSFSGELYAPLAASAQGVFTCGLSTLDVTAVNVSAPVPEGSEACSPDSCRELQSHTDWCAGSLLMSPLQDASLSGLAVRSPCVVAGQEEEEEEDLQQRHQTSLNASGDRSIRDLLGLIDRTRKCSPTRTLPRDMRHATATARPASLLKHT